MESVSASCDCAVFDRDAWRGVEIAGGGAAIEVTGEIHTGLHSGRLSRTVTLRTASGREFRADIILDVIGTWAVSTDNVDFGTLEFDSPDVAAPEFVVHFAPNPDSLVGSPVADVPWLTCVSKQLPGGGIDVLLRVVPDRLTQGVNVGAVQLKTTSSCRPNASISARITAVPAIVATPPAVFLVGSERRLVRITDRDGRPVPIVGIDVSCPSLKVQPLDSGTIEVRNSEGTSLMEAATIRVSDRTGRVVSILVTAF